MSSKPSLVQDDAEKAFQPLDAELVDRCRYLRSALEDIAMERGHCGACGRVCDRDSNCTPFDCERRDCVWEPMDAAAFAKEALNGG